MGKYFAVGSITNALKGRDILSGKGIHSYIERTPQGMPGGGCGYSIYVPGDFRTAEKVLDSAGLTGGRKEGNRR
mgnify:FL=1